MQVKRLLLTAVPTLLTAMPAMGSYQISNEAFEAKVKSDIYMAASECFYYLGNIKSTTTSSERAAIANIGVLGLNSNKFSSYNFSDLERKYAFMGLSYFTEFMGAMSDEEVTIKEQDIYIIMGKNHMRMEESIENEPGDTKSQKAASAFRYKKSNGDNCLSHLISLGGINSILGEKL